MFQMLGPGKGDADGLMDTFDVDINLMNDQTFGDAAVGRWPTRYCDFHIIIYTAASLERSVWGPFSVPAS